jgi:hypothetical protein
MPSLPKYESKVSLPAIDLPRVPQGAGSEVGAAMTRAGGQIASIGIQWVDAMNKAEAEAQVSTAMAEASVQLQDLRNRVLDSGDFNTDPERARSIWEAEAGKVGQNLSGTVTNRLAKQRFQESWQKILTSHSLSMSDETRKKRVDIVKGSGLRSINSFADAAASAPNEAIFRENLNNAVTTVRGLMASGAIGYDDGVRLERAAIDQAHKTRILNIALQNPVAAQAMLEKAQLGGEISPDTALRLGEHMKPLVDAQASRGIADQVLSGGVSGKRFDKDGGERANNIGNIRASATSFRTYATPEEGVADAIVLLRRGYSGRSIKQIGAKWAPPSENDTPQWVRNVAAASGLNPETVLDLNDEDTVKKLIKGIGAAEKSEKDLARFTPEIIEKGVALAKGGSAPSGPVTARDIEKNYSAFEADVRARAQAARPGDAVFEDHAVSHFRQQAGIALQARKLEDNANMDTLLQAVISGGITSESQLLSNPKHADAYASLFASSPEKIIQIRGLIDHNADADERKNAYTPEKAATYKDYMDLFAADPDAFLKRTDNLVADLPNLGKENYQRIIGLRAELLSGKKNHEAESLQHAVNGEIDAFFPTKLAPKSGDALEKWNVTKANAFAAIDGAIRAEKAENKGKPVSPDRAREIARGYLIPGSVAGTGFMGWGITEGRAIELQENEKFVPEQSKVPDRFRSLIDEYGKQDPKNKATAKFDSKNRQWYILYKGERFYDPKTGLNQSKPKPQTSLLRKPIPVPEEGAE